MKTDLRKNKLQWLSGVLALAVLGLTVGCGGGGGTTQDPGQGMTDDQKAVEQLVGSVSDLAGSLDRVRALFTKDAAPSKALADKYKDHMFQIEGDINVAGDNATMTVKAIGFGENASPKQNTWKAQKVGGEWKLSDAPL